MLGACLTGGLSEATALSALQINPEDNAVQTGNWCWSPEEQWPPWSCVLDTPFWQQEWYRPLWDMLRTPLATPHMVLDDGFITIDTVAPQTTGHRRFQASTGLIHLTGMKPGSRVPQRLQDLKYQVVFIEVGAEDTSSRVHSLARHCLNNQPDVVVVVVGEPTVSTRGIVEQMVQEMSSSGVVIRVYFNGHTFT